MATDFFVARFYWIVALAFLGLAIAAAIAARKSPSPASPASLAGSLLRGYFGLMFGMFLYAWIETTLVGLNKVELGHITSGDLPGWIPQWSIYIFVLFAPFALVLFSVIGLPFYLALRKFNKASIVTMLIGVVAASVVAGAYSYLKPHNNWCEANQFLCFVHSAWGLAFPALIAVLFFSICVPLPVLRQNSNAN